MKRHLLRITGLAILALLIQSAGFAQQDSTRDGDDDVPRRVDEIIIRHNGNKDAKVTIEIKDGDVLVNGKPMADFDDSSLTIRKRRVMRNGSSFSFNGSDYDYPGAIQIIPDDNGNRVFSYGNNDILRGNRAQLGVVTEKNDDGAGVRITELTRESAAQKIGLKVGDVITKVDETEISDPGSLSESIRSHKPGDKVMVTFTRDGKQQKLAAVLGKAKDLTVEPLSTYKFNMPDMRTFTPDAWPKGLMQVYGNSMRFGIRAQDDEDGKGAKVLDVDDESTAAKAGLKEGDIITRFDGKEIKSVTDLTEAARAAKGKTSVKMSVLHDGKPRDLEVKVPRRLKTADL